MTPFVSSVAVTPGQPLFAALAGFFKVRLTAQRPAAEQAVWLGEAIARLNLAVERAPGLSTYFRGLALAGLPAKPVSPRRPSVTWSGCGHIARAFRPGYSGASTTPSL